MEKAKKEKDNGSMRFLSEKKKPSENVAFGAIVAALYAVLSLLIAFFPSLSIFLTFFLPLFAALVGYLCLPPYVLAFVIGSSCLSLGVSFFNIGEVLFSIIPSILTGSFFGLLLKKKLRDEVVIALVSFLQMGLYYLTIYLLQTIFGLNPINTFFDLIKIEKTARIDALIPGLLLSLSLAQTSLTNFLLGILSMHIPLKEENQFVLPKIVLPVSGLLFGALTLAIGPFNTLTGGLFLVLSIYFGITSISILFNEKRWWIYLLGGILLLIFFFIRTFLLELYQEELFLYALFTLPLDFMALFSNLLKRRKNDEIS